MCFKPITLFITETISIQLLKKEKKKRLNRPVNWLSYNNPHIRVSGNTGTGAFIFGEQGILSNYFQATRELLIRLL